VKSALLGFVGAALVSSASGCASIFGYDKAVVLAVTEIAAPASIPSGTRLSAVVTVESGGCREFDRLETKRNQSGATFVAWGRDRGGKNVSCPADVRYDRVPAHFDPPFGSTFTLAAGRDRLAPISVTVRIDPVRID
jgi:hypothetical protein